jgi:hypothetical protein
MNTIESNEVYIEIQKRTDKLIELREHAQNIAEYANKECAMCSYISCFDCPMNVGKNEIVCISNVKVIR